MFIENYEDIFYNVIQLNIYISSSLDIKLIKIYRQRSILK